MRQAKNKQVKRKIRVRKRLAARASRPRLSVFRSNQKVYVQIIDDAKSTTLISASEAEIKPPSQKITKKPATSDKKNSPTSTDNLSSKTARARLVGELIAQKASKAKIKQVVFDRGPYKYHGRVKAVAEGARSKGLVF